MILTALLIIGGSFVFASLCALAVFFIETRADRRERHLKHERDINILRVNKFLQ